MKKDKKIIIKVRGIILFKGNLLMVKHANHSKYLALPGGHLEKGEEIEECLSREIFEELGVKPQIGRLFYMNTFTDDDKQYVEFFFEIKNGKDYLNSENLIRSHSHEINKIVWVTPGDNLSIRPKSFALDFKTGKIISNQIRYIKD